MGNYNVKCTDNTIIYEYADEKSRLEKKPSTTHVTYNNKFQLDSKYKPLFEHLKKLDGDNSSLSPQDLAQGKAVLHEHGIKEARVDANGNIATFVYRENNAITIDMGLDTKDKAKRDLELAKEMGYDEYYDIKLSDDSKFYEIEVKKTPFYMPNPKAITVAQDFGVKDVHTIYENNIKNFPKFKEKTSFGEGNTLFVTDDSNAVFKKGYKFRLPVESVTIQKDLNDFFGRLIDKVCSYGYETTVNEYYCNNDLDYLY